MRSVPAMAVFRQSSVVVAMCIGLGLGAGTARAGWPTPAGGESASGDPEVLFTFDDGPHEKHTAAILDELGRRGIKAVFFWVGWRITKGGGQAQERVRLVQRAVREGHLVANHTISHPNLCLIKPEQAAYEIDDNIRVFEAASGLPILLFRAPYGAHCKRLKHMLAERSLVHMHWDIDPQEWSDHDSKRTARVITRKLERLEGRAIVIMHDTHKVTVNALPKILDWIEEENERRKKKGDKRLIRIINGSDLVLERPDARTLERVVEAGMRSADHLTAVLDRLVP